MAGRWLTFDCFGTLIDWRHGIATSAELVFPGRGNEFVDAFVEIETQVENEVPFRRYRAVLAETTRRAAMRLSLQLRPDDADVLATTIQYWQPFDDVGPALAELQKDGWQLALLTNCDRDLIALTRRRLPAPFDVVVTAEDVSAYKPNHAHFRAFQSGFGSEADDWIHVAQSHFHDIRPANQLGIKRIWVNRHGAKDDPSIADAVIRGLADLPGVVSTLASGD